MIPVWLLAWGSKALSFIGKVLVFGITLPVWAFLVAGAWWHFDKSSAIRQAVDRAVTELVAGEELAALQARNESLMQINNEVNRRLAAEQAVNRQFEERQAEADRKNEDLQNELQDIIARPPPVPADGVCRIDDSVFGILRNR